MKKLSTILFITIFGFCTSFFAQDCKSFKIQSDSDVTDRDIEVIHILQDANGDFYIESSSIKSSDDYVLLYHEENFIKYYSVSVNNVIIKSDNAPLEVCEEEIQIKLEVNGNVIQSLTIK